MNNQVLGTVITMILHLEIPSRRASCIVHKLCNSTNSLNLFILRKRISVFRKEHFNAAHRLHQPAWSEEENERVFGKCNNPYFHGHNYELIVQLTGEIDPQTGYLYDLKRLSDLIKAHVLDRFDHKNLNLEVEEFKQVNPTAENIAVVIYEILENAIQNPNLDLKIRLYETERNYVEYPA